MPSQRRTSTSARAEAEPPPPPPPPPPMLTPPTVPKLAIEPVARLAGTLPIGLARSESAAWRRMPTHSLSAAHFSAPLSDHECETTACT